MSSTTSKGTKFENDIFDLIENLQVKRKKKPSGERHYSLIAIGTSH